jgi:hypothetical protein
MPKRHEPSHDEIEALATTFRALWRRGKPLRPWLRKHRQMVLDLVHDEWSWDSIAKVFSVAGIKYREGKGRDWRGEGLRCEFARAALPLKRDKNRTIVVDEHQYARTIDGASILLSGETPAASASVVSLAASDRAGSVSATPAAQSVTRPALTTPAPIFKAFSLKPQETQPGPSPAEYEEQEAIRKRMFGQ